MTDEIMRCPTCRHKMNMLWSFINGKKFVGWWCSMCFGGAETIIKPIGREKNLPLEKDKDVH